MIPALRGEMQMFSHVCVGAKDLKATKAFYDTVLGALGHAAGIESADRIIYTADGGILVAMTPYDGNPATSGNGVTVGFNAPNAAAVDAFHAEGIKAGGTDEGAPGPRPAIENSYSAYLRDPAGNKLVAWCVTQP